jgi:hypothetical protein
MEGAQRYEPQPSEAARSERDEAVTALIATGVGGAEWNAPLDEMERGWLGLDVKAGIGIELSPRKCYRGGCTVTVTLPSVSAQERFRSLAQNSTLMQLWKGGGFTSGPIRTDSGEIEVTWVFYAPQVTPPPAGDRGQNMLN